jgi:hypothetical protein
VTLPDEELRAVLYAHDFLSELACGWKFDYFGVGGGEARFHAIKSDHKRVPGSVRERARRILKHFPSRSEISRRWPTSG